MKKLQKPLIWILIAGAALGLFYKLDQQYLWTDEVFSFHAAQRIVETGELIFETGFPYERSPIYHQIVAYSMSLSENDVWASRIVNIPFILLTAIILFFLQKDEKNYIRRLVPVLLYLSANLTLAMARETRMYAMTTAIFSLMIFSFYKAYIAPEKKFSFTVLKTKYTVDIFWGIIFALVTLLGVLHHPIILLFGLVLLAYFIIEGIIEKKKGNILILIGKIVLALAYSYYVFGNVDLTSLFSELSPNWGDSSYIYYLILIARNFPWILALSPIIVMGALRDRTKKGLYLNIVLITYLVLISLQGAKHERYLQLILPVLIMQSINYIFTLKELLKSQPILIRRATRIVVIALILFSHSYLYIKELNEISTYTEHSIALQKKFEFTEAVEFIDQFEDAEIIADFHSAFTLMSQGVKVKKILVTQDHPELERGESDVYYGIDFITFPEELKVELEDGEKDILIIRDTQTYSSVNEDLMKKIEGFETPAIFVER